MFSATSTPVTLMAPNGTEQASPNVEEVEQRSASASASASASVYGHEQWGEPEHRPDTGQEEEYVYVLTLKTTESIAEPMNEMRSKYFPKHLNNTPAHLTLFHALPHSQLEAMEADLGTASVCTRRFRISTGAPFHMRHGVAVGLGDGSNKFLALREELRRQWLGWLSRQDSGAWQPHWTVMNKVDEEKKVERAFNTIRRDLFENVQDGWAIGLELWRYDNGEWQWMKDFSFPGNGKSPLQTPVKSQSSSKLDGYFDVAGHKTAKSTGMLKRNGGSLVDLLMLKGVRRKEAKEAEW